MDGYLRQSTASQSRLIGPFIDDTDFKTEKTALTIANTDVKLRADGTTLSNKNSGGGTHQVNGMYSLTWDATDTANVGELKYSVKVSGALQVFGSYTVLEEAVYDMLFASSAPGYISNAPVNVQQFGGSNGTFSSGRPEVNTTHAAGTAWASGAITAAAIASDAITAAKVAADVSAEIADAIADEALAGHVTAGTAGKAWADAAAASGGDGSSFTDIPWNPDWDPEVQSEVEDALAARFDAPRPQRGQEAIPASASMMAKIDDLHKLARNKATEDATTTKVFADDGVTVDHKGTNSWDGTTFTRGEIVSGP